jgi:hypothetical protein
VWNTSPIESTFAHCPKPHLVTRDLGSKAAASIQASKLILAAHGCRRAVNAPYLVPLARAAPASNAVVWFEFAVSRRR